MCLACVYKRTWVAQRIFARRAGYLHFGVRTRVVLSTFTAVVISLIERAARARFAFAVLSVPRGDESLARSALCDCHQHNTPV